MTNANTLRTGFSFVRISIMSALVLALLFLGAPVPSAYAVTAAEKQAEANAVMQKIDALQGDLNVATADHNKAVSEHDTAQAAMEEAQHRVDAAEKRINELQVRLANRASSMYKGGTSSFLDVMLGSSSFDEFLTAWDMMDKISSQDASLVQESKDLRTEAENARIEYSTQKDKASTEMAKSKALKDQIETTQASLRGEVAKITAEAAELQAQEDLAAEQAAAAKAAAEKAQQQQSQGGGGGSNSGYVPGGGGSSSVVGSGQFAHPCPGAALSSDFGWRSFDNSFHNGIDLAAGEGTPYYAAADGTVIIAGYSGSAGNWIVISHGNGLVTKYMHSSAIYVSAGQQVSKGQNIGAVGNTGNSFGAHLHFQVEEGASGWSGTPVNPYHYL
ncbi:MAG: peptidoglycan DD-metalloendopeptidase family protein [Eggerthellaceae bacterium]